MEYSPRTISSISSDPSYKHIQVHVYFQSLPHVSLETRPKTLAEKHLRIGYAKINKFILKSLITNINVHGCPSCPQVQVHPVITYECMIKIKVAVCSALYSRLRYECVTFGRDGALLVKGGRGAAD